MRLCIISDTHGSHDDVEIPDSDVLIHCGDWTYKSTALGIENFSDWFSSHYAKHKIIICGNHDDDNQARVAAHYSSASSSGRTFRNYSEIFTSLGVNYLQDNSVKINGLKFYGMPWTPEFYNWYWMLARNSHHMARKCEMIEDDTNILITHGPRFGTLDQTDHDRCGCEKLAERVKYLNNLKLHCFGHIHEAYGQTYTGTSVNAAIMNEHYKPVNKPTIVDLDV